MTAVAQPSGWTRSDDAKNAVDDERSLVEQRQPIAPFIPADRAHSSDTFTGYSEPIPQGSQYITIRGLYAAETQFDTLSVLSHVYTRPNPKIELGPIDDSVSFVVVDASKHDYPIVYCSRNFEQLTGYTRQEIINRNCRFLQFPPQDVLGDGPGGVTRPRAYSESQERSPAVEAFKKSLMLGQECQASLVNYRRDGEAFLNLISVVPVKWKEEDTGEVKDYYVGFQVDLNEALNATAGIPGSLPGSPVQQKKAIYQPQYNQEDLKRGPGDESWNET